MRLVHSHFRIKYFNFFCVTSPIIFIGHVTQVPCDKCVTIQNRKIIWFKVSPELWFKPNKRLLFVFDDENISRNELSKIPRNDSWGASEVIDKTLLLSTILQFSIRMLGWTSSSVDWLGANGGDSEYGTGWCHLVAIIFFLGLNLISLGLFLVEIRDLQTAWSRRKIFQVPENFVRSELVPVCGSLV